MHSLFENQNKTTLNHTPAHCCKQYSHPSTQVFKDISRLQHSLPSHVPSSLIQIFLLTSQRSSFYLYSRKEPQIPFNRYLTYTKTLRTLRGHPEPNCCIYCTKHAFIIRRVTSALNQKVVNFKVSPLFHSRFSTTMKRLKDFWASKPTLKIIWSST